MKPLQKSESSAATGLNADQITNALILPPAQKCGKSVMQPVERGTFQAQIGGAT
jgi:hypothetical protein